MSNIYWFKHLLHKISLPFFPLCDNDLNIMSFGLLVEQDVTCGSKELIKCSPSGTHFIR